MQEKVALVWDWETEIYYGVRGHVVCHDASGHKIINITGGFFCMTTQEILRHIEPKESVITCWGEQGAFRVLFDALGTKGTRLHFVRPESEGLEKNYISRKKWTAYFDYMLSHKGVLNGLSLEGDFKLAAFFLFCGLHLQEDDSPRDMKAFESIIDYERFLVCV